MKKHSEGIKWLTIGVLFLVISSCEIYQSKVPITNSNDSIINKDLTGRWIGLSQDEFQHYPQIEIMLQSFNEKEYIGQLTHYNDKGRNISSTELYKVFNTIIESDEYLNIKPIGTNDQNFIFYKIEKDFKDSIHIRYLTDSLKLKFETSNEFKDYLVKEELKFETEFLSPPIPFYRWRTLTWDHINKINRTDQFDKFYILGKIKEDYFKSAPDSELEELVIGKEEINIDTIQSYFNNIQLADNRLAFWKVPMYGLIKLKSGNFVKIKYDLRGPIIRDLTNNIKYLNRNEDNLSFK
ncbi:MAG: hypothetical protein AB8F74_12870 [Saprospiraceae bacterium]